jgi:hypothetical protein
MQESMEGSSKSIHCFAFGEETKYPCLSMCLEKETTPSQMLGVAIHVVKGVKKYIVEQCLEKK